MDGALKGRVICITGASRGLGAAMARAFDAAGASLVLGARNQEDLSVVAASCRDAVALPCDVREADQVNALVQGAVERHGRLDVMVNNAGLAIYGPVDALSSDEIGLVLDTNVKGVILGSQAAFRQMREQKSGHIVNISSIAGKLHLPNESVYNASKWAVNGFTGTLRMEAEAHGIKVSCVCPGGIDTPFWHGMEYTPFPDHIDPVRDFMKPKDVAETVLHVVASPGPYVVPEVVMQPMM